MTGTDASMVLAVGIDAQACLAATKVVQNDKRQRQPGNTLGNTAHHIAGVVKAEIDAAERYQRDHQHRGTDRDVCGMALRCAYREIDGKQSIEYGRGHRVATRKTVGRKAEKRIVEHRTATLDEMLQAKIERVAAQHHRRQHSRLSVPAPVRKQEAASDGDNRYGRRSAEAAD